MTNLSTKKLMVFASIFVILTFLSIKFIGKVIGEGGELVHMDKISLLPLILIVSIVYYLLDAYRLYYILKVMEEKISYWYILKITFVNAFVSNITPMATGGGFLQLYLLNKKGVRLARATSATTMRTVIALSYFIISVPLALIFLHPIRNIMFDPQNRLYLYFGFSGYGIFLFLILKLIKKRNMKIVVKNSINFINRFREKKISFRFINKEIDIFYTGIDKLFHKPKEAILVVGITYVFMMSLFSIAYTLILNFGGNIGYVDVLLFQSIVTFFMYFAVTPGAAGIAELVYSLMYREFVPPEYLMSFTFLWRFFSVHIPMVIGVYYTYKEIMRLDFIKKK